MKKYKPFVLTAFSAIVLSSCSQNDYNVTTGDWDGVDYNTGTDTVIDNHTYHCSSYGYWYWENNGRVTRYYPHTGYYETLTVNEHRTGRFLLSSAHASNGGASEEPAHFSSGHAGAVEGFGRTAHSISSRGFGHSAHGGSGHGG